MAEDMSWDSAKEVQSNWFKFEKPGDKIKGTLLKKTFSKGEAPFPDQWVYQIEDESGTAWNVGISAKKSGTIGRLDNCALGERIGIAYEKEIPPTTKGFNPTKVLKVVSWGADPNYSAPAEEISIDDIAF